MTASLKEAVFFKASRTRSDFVQDYQTRLSFRVDHTYIQLQCMKTHESSRNLTPKPIVQAS